MIEYLKQTQVPLTVCPLSNLKLKVFPSLEKHNLKQLLELGLCVTINSDDPAYFGGYLVENFWASQQALQLTLQEVVKLAQNSIKASFMPPAWAEPLMTEITSLENQFISENTENREIKAKQP